MGHKGELKKDLRPIAHNEHGRLHAVGRQHRKRKDGAVYIAAAIHHARTDIESRSAAAATAIREPQRSTAADQTPCATTSPPARSNAPSDNASIPRSPAKQRSARRRMGIAGGLAACSQWQAWTSWSATAMACPSPASALGPMSRGSAYRRYEATAKRAAPPHLHKATRWGRGPKHQSLGREERVIELDYQAHADEKAWAIVAALPAWVTGRYRRLVATGLARTRERGDLS